MDGWHPSCTQGPVNGVCQCVSRSCLHMINRLHFPVFQNPVKPDALGHEWEVSNHLSSKQGRPEAQCGSGQSNQLTGCRCLMCLSDSTRLGRERDSQIAPALALGREGPAQAAEDLRGPGGSHTIVMQISLCRTCGGSCCPGSEGFMYDWMFRLWRDRGHH